MGDMEMRSPDKIEVEKGDEDSRNYLAPNMSSDWQFNGATLATTSMGLISAENPMTICKGDLIESSSCSTASMVNSFCPTIWDQTTTNSQNMGFCDVNVQNNAISSSALGFRKGNLGPPRTDLERALDMGWTPQTSMLKQSMLLPTSSRMIPQSLSQFPTDTGFIERAARFSCFSGGNYTDIVNPFSIPESMSPYSRGTMPMQGPQNVYARLNSVSGGQSQKNEMIMVERSNDDSMPIEHEANRGSPLNLERNSESILRSHDQAKQSLCEPRNDSDEAEFNNGAAQAEPSAVDGTGGGTPTKSNGLKKRKRPGQQDTELDQVTGTSNPPEIAEDNSGIQLKQDHNATSTINKPGGKHGKHGSQASDSNKEDYIHVRARRGQATNSHSLAERVRREKISERMKYLQDLVPGCSKVTGKAVMLDEIINYVQSLQRQVEFLSMKLATVNPRPDFNIEGLLAKDILQSRAGPSSALGFHPDMSMPYAPMHLSHGLIQASLAGMGTSPDALRRTINSHLTAVSGGYKEPNSQVPNVWDDELHNIVQMGLNSNITLDEEDLVGPTSHLKAEL